MKSNKQIFRGKKILGMCFVISFCIRVNKGENKLHANTQIISLKMFNSRTRGQVWNDSSTTARGRGCRQGGGWGGSRNGGGGGGLAVFVKWCCSVSDYASLMAAQLIRANRLWTLFMTSARAEGVPGGRQEGWGRSRQFDVVKKKIH